MQFCLQLATPRPTARHHTPEEDRQWHCCRPRKRHRNLQRELLLNDTHKRIIQGEEEAYLVALTCGEPPSGQSRWTLRLLAEKMVKLEYIDTVSHETIRTALKKMSLSLGNGKSGASPQKQMQNSCAKWKRS